MSRQIPASSAAPKPDIFVKTTRQSAAKNQVFLKTCLDNFPAVHMAANLDIFQETGQFLAFNLGIFGKMSGKFIAVFAAAKQDIFAKMLRPLAVKKLGILRETFGKLPARLLARKCDVFFDKTTEYFATKKQVF